MQRQFIVGGNWKMNGNRALVKEISQLMRGQKVAQVVIAPPAPLLAFARSEFAAEIGISAQNCSNFKNGAFTGEVNVDLLKDLSIDWVILGHSERRSIFKESEENIAEKVAFAVKNGLKVIACCGESLEDRQAGKTMDRVVSQMQPIANKLTQDEWKHVVIAYEPGKIFWFAVWAIGTGVVATPEQAQETQKELRDWLAKTVSPSVANETRIMYGGSVNAKNCGSLASQNDIDGFLVGGASLKATEFLAICKSKL